MSNLGIYAVCPYWLSEYRSQIICEGLEDGCTTRVAFDKKADLKVWRTAYCESYSYSACPYCQAISEYKYKEVSKVTDEERMKYLLGAQKRMLEAREREVEKLRGQLKASCLWVAYLLDQVMGDRNEIEIPKDRLYRADEKGILFSEDTKKGCVKLRRNK